MDSELNKGLEDLRKQYALSIKNKLSTIKDLIEKARQFPQKESVLSLRMEVHKIAGNAALYGYPAAASLCRAMDRQLLEKIEQAKVSGSWVLDEEQMSDFYKELVKKFI